MPSPTTLNHIAMSNNMRKLWEDNSQWTRLLIHSIYHDRGDRALFETRLFKAGDTAGAFFQQYYGEEIGRKVQETHHALIHTLGNMVSAYRDGDEAGISSAREAMYHGSDTLAELYAQINRFWDKASVQKQLYAIVNAMENEITSIAAGDSAQEIEAHDHLMSQAYSLTDALTAGLLRQLQLF